MHDYIRLVRYTRQYIGGILMGLGTATVGAVLYVHWLGTDLFTSAAFQAYAPFVGLVISGIGQYLALPSKKRSGENAPMDITDKHTRA